MKIAGTVYSDTIHQSFLARLKIGVRVYCPRYFFALCLMTHAETLPIATLRPSLVKDVDATREILKSRGAKIVVEPVDFGKIARIMMVADPDGNWVEFAAPK
jgi:hypothetical protein